MLGGIRTFNRRRMRITRVWPALLLIVLDVHAMNTAADDSDNAVVWNCTKGEWVVSERPPHSHNTVHTTHSPGCSATFYFKGSGVYWYTTLQPGGGDASVTIDSESPVYVSTDRPNTSYRAAVFTNLSLDEKKRHNVTITSLSSRPLDVDFFAVISPDPAIKAASALPIAPVVLLGDNQGSPISTEAIIGISVGGAVALIAVITIIVLWYRRKNRKIELEAAAAAAEPYMLYGPGHGLRSPPTTRNSAPATHRHESAPPRSNPSSGRIDPFPPSSSTASHGRSTTSGHDHSSPRRYTSSDPLVPTRPSQGASTPSTSQGGRSRQESSSVRNRPEKSRTIRQNITREIVEAAITQRSNPTVSASGGSHSYPPPSSRAETRLDHINTIGLRPTGPLSEISAATASSGHVDPDPPLRTSPRSHALPTPPTPPTSPRTQRSTQSYANLRPEDIHQIADLVVQRLREPGSRSTQSLGR